MTTLHRILVIKLADIGDLLTATPALRALRFSLPETRLELLTTPAAAAVLPSGLADTVLTAPRNLVRGPADLAAAYRLLNHLRRTRYEAVLLLHHLTLGAGAAKYRLLAALTGAPLRVGLDNGRGAWLTHRVADEGFGAQHEVRWALEVAAQLGARLPADDAAALQAAADFPAAAALVQQAFPDPSAPRVAIHPGSGGYAPARRWDAAHWAALADALVQRYGAQIALVGTSGDGSDAVAALMQHPVANLAGQSTLPALAALLAQCHLFIGADSGVMHLAAAAAVPVVALFGPTNPLAWGPWAPLSQARVVRLGLRCSPCSYVGHSVGARNGCWHRSCLAELQPHQVLQAVAEIAPFSSMKQP
ncbi:MAG: glycosyltransferase family 9 protein [Caldilineales bacterium]|mgnify:CR=1 FL=1